MHTLHRPTRRATLCAAVAAAATSTGLLGGTAALFASAGSTPTFTAGSSLAQQAALCPYPLSQPARHSCLRDIAASAARPQARDAVLMARASGHSN